MASKTTAEAAWGHPLQIIESENTTGLEQLKDDVEEVVKLVDFLRKSSFRDNLIRNEIANGALDLISGRLRQALGDL